MVDSFGDVIWDEYNVHSFPITDLVYLLYNVELREWTLRKEEDVSSQEEEEVLVEDEETKFPEDGIYALGIFLSYTEFVSIRQDLYQSLGMHIRG